MKNREKLLTAKDEPIDEVAVGILLERIMDDVSKNECIKNYTLGIYMGFYKRAKQWLESEADE